MSILWRHKERRTLYVEVEHAELQASTGPVTEGDTLLIYKDVNTGKVWARKYSEFMDGRFEALGMTRE